MAHNDAVSLIDVFDDIEKLKFELWVYSMEQSIADGVFTSFEEGLHDKSNPFNLTTQNALGRN